MIQRPETPSGPDHERVVDRSFQDSSGVAWEVSEIAGEQVPGARGESCLVFISLVAIRRVWHYPKDWRDLPAEVLESLSWNA